ARGTILELLAQQTQNQMPGGHISVQSNGPQMRTAMAGALLHGAGASQELGKESRDLRGLTLMEMARRAVESTGVSTGSMNRNDIARMALTTSDFPHIFSDVANKILRDSYEATERTFMPFTRRRTATDFRHIHSATLGGAPSLKKKNESGEYEYGAMKEAGSSYKLDTFGRVVALTREMIINDDLDAFTKLSSAFGAAAARLENDVVWDLFINQAFDGSNTASGNGSGLTLESLAKARTEFRKRKNIDGQPMNLTPKFLIVSPEHETNAEQL